jgi:hypothetical protein
LILRPLHTVNPAVSKQLSDAVDWALEMHPDDRPASIEVLSQAINGQIAITPKKDTRSNENKLGQALIENAAMIIIALVLFAAAVFFTTN